ncbi:hypothetical protein PIB30_073820 [Stylosanthes scabra]|uniref:PB1-like domain-containing protein n=1 Tax=Stylosanthes scabra TaxID=79078 RepID=A0ABU6YMP7_9FABA|nr:hypothetical protein [Stylosanthes scabra]
MGDTFVVPIFHHGGSFVRNPLGELEYVNGLVERFEEMDLDFVNFGDMVKLFEDLRYTKYKAVYWLDKNAPELETGLNELEGDAGIREMLDYLRLPKITLDSSSWKLQDSSSSMVLHRPRSDTSEQLLLYPLQPLEHKPPV